VNRRGKGKLVVSLKCVDMLNTHPIICLLVGIGYGINTVAEDYPAKVQRFENALKGKWNHEQSITLSGSREPSVAKRATGGYFTWQ
jgi:hypothetical protein